MGMPVRALPVAQNWDCHGCTNCCRSYHVPVSAEERKRIDDQRWETDPELAGTPVIERSGSWWSGYEYRLASRPNGDCVFLDPAGRCRIHARHGGAAKPLACRVFPYLLVPTANEWRLGLRFACPTAGENAGRPLAEHVADARGCAAELEEASPGVRDAPPVPLARGQFVPWADLFRIVTALSKALADTTAPLEWRWRKVLGLVAMLRAAKFDGGKDPTKTVTAGRLNEMMYVLGLAMDDETPRDPEMVPRPGWAGRVVFRPVLAAYVRKDTGSERGTAQRSAFGRLGAAMRFARGTGRIPRVHALIPEGVTFAQAEEPAGPLPAESDELLTRYYRVKLESMQFCGAANFDLPFWDGLESLAITFPVISWLARVLAAGGRSRAEAVKLAVRIVDDNFGFNKLLGLGRQKYALRILSNRGELQKLVAWYGR